MPPKTCSLTELCQRAAAAQDLLQKAMGEMPDFDSESVRVEYESELSERSIQEDPDANLDPDDLELWFDLGALDYERWKWEMSLIDEELQMENEREWERTDSPSDCINWSPPEEEEE